MAGNQFTLCERDGFFKVCGGRKAAANGGDIRWDQQWLCSLHAHGI